MKKLKLPGRGAVMSMALSPDGNWLAVGQMGDDDGKPALTLWSTGSTASWKCAGQFATEGFSIVRSLSFDRSSQTLAYALNGVGVGFIDLNSMQSKNTVAFPNPVHVRYGRHRDVLLVSGTVVTVFDASMERTLWKDPAYQAGVQSPGIPAELLKGYYILSDSVTKGAYRNLPACAVLCDDDFAVMLAGRNDGLLTVVELATGGTLREYPRAAIQADRLEMDEAENHLFLISRIPHANFLWDFRTMERLLPQYLNEEFRGSPTVALHSAAPFFATGNAVGAISLRSIATGAFLMTENAHRGEVNALLFSRDGRTLISGGNDAKVLFTDVSKVTAA